MARCTKDIEIELSDGTIVEGKLKVNGAYDEALNFELGATEGGWFVDSWDTEIIEELDEDQRIEFDEKVEDIVFSEKWDFDNPDDEDEEE